MSRADILATTRAVAIAEDAFSDARSDYRAGQITVESFSEVEQALWQVRRIAAAGTPPVESP